MPDARPIGVFDSGVGGLSVVRELRRLLPRESVVYYADTRNCPYGHRPEPEIQEIAAQASRFLLDRGAKLIVVACNTASSVALARLRATFEVPFVGMVPAVKPATLATRARRVLVLATAATVQAEVFNELVDQFASGIQVHTQACPGLVDLVESGNDDPELATPLLHRYLEPVPAHGIDTVVLGCTHFVFLRDDIQKLVGAGVKVIDTGEAVARQVRRVLRDRGLEAGPGSEGVLTLLASGDQERFMAVAARLLDKRLRTIPR
ncbi:MAG: glutamate racemase [Dehalococcoidia bacterium]|nr:glutamate racemase [Dehalococcoidia bacterium]